MKPNQILVAVLLLRINRNGTTNPTNYTKKIGQDVFADMTIRSL